MDIFNGIQLSSFLYLKKHIDFGNVLLYKSILFQLNEGMRNKIHHLQNNKLSRISIILLFSSFFIIQ